MRATKTMPPSRRKKRSNSDAFEDLVGIPTLPANDMTGVVEYQRIDTPALLSRVDPNVRDSVAVSRKKILAKEMRLRPRAQELTLSQRRWIDDTFRLWLLCLFGVLGLGAMTFALLYLLFPVG